MATDTQELVRKAKASGFTIRKTRGGHLEFVAPDGQKVTAPSTPSDTRSVANTLADLKKIGLQVNGSTRTKASRPKVEIRGGPSAMVLEFLQEHPNEDLESSAIREKLDLEGRQVNNALNFLAGRIPEISSVGRGLWRYATDDAQEQHEEVIHVAKEPSVDEVDEVLCEIPTARGGLGTEARKQPQARIEMVGPDQAKYWLSANLKNRDLRKSRVVHMAGILNRDEWQLTSNGIGFDTFGRLIDGQHRLAAILVSGKVAPCVVVRGLKSKAQDVTDRNLARSLGDTLKLRGESYTTALAAGLAWLYRFNYMEQTGLVFYRNPGERPTTPQLLQLLDDNPAIRDAVADFSRGQASSDVPVRSGVGTALMYRMRRIHKGHANLFFQQLFDGTDLHANSAVYVLRRQLLMNASRNFERMPDYREAAIIVKAWNAWREDKPVTNLKYAYGPTHKDPFPIPQ